LTSLDLSDNKLGTLVSPGGWSSTFGGVWKYRHSDGRYQDNKPEGEEFKPEGIIAIANAIPDMGALTKFDISENGLKAEGGMELAAGLKGNQVITELNIGGNSLGMNSSGGVDTSGVVVLADAIPDMGALIKLDISSNNIGGEQEGELQRICVASGIVLAK
jgi:hypothetical protein